MVDQVDTIATELTLRYAQYVSGVDTVVKTNSRLSKSITDLTKLGVEAPPQYADAAAKSVAKGADAHEKATARIKQARKAQVDVIKQSGNEEIAAEIATQQRLSKAVEDGIAARSAAVRKGSGTVIGSTVQGRANNARQGLMTGVSSGAVATADVEAGREVNHLALDTYDLEQKRKVLTGQRLADVERELELQRRIEVYKAKGLTEEEAQLRAETKLVEMETLRAEKETALAAAQKAGGGGSRRHGIGGVNEFALNASGGRFGYSLGPGAVAGVGILAGGAIVDSAAKYGQQISDTSSQLGISTHDLQVYQAMATKVGVSNEQLATSFGGLAEKISQARDGDKSAGKLFGKNGLNIDISQFKSAGDALPTVIDRLNKMGDAGKRAAIGQALFGTEYRKLDSVLSGGNAKIAEFGKAMGDSILSDQQIQSLKDTSVALEDVKRELLVDFSKTVAGNKNAIIGLADALASLTGELLKLAGAHPQETFALLGAYLGRAGGVPGVLVGAAAGYAVGDKIDKDAADGNTDPAFRYQQVVAAQKRLQDARNSASGPQFSLNVAPGGGGVPYRTDSQAVADRAQSIQQAQAEVRRQADLYRKARVSGAPAGKAPVVQPGNPGNGNVFGGNGRKGPSEETLQKQAAARQKRFEDEQAQLSDSFLQSLQGLSTSTDERYRLAAESVKTDHDRRETDIELQVKEHQIDAAREQELKAANDIAYAGKLAVLAAQKRAEQLQTIAALQEQQVDFERQHLQNQDAFARTPQDRLKNRLSEIDVDQQAERDRDIKTAFDPNASDADRQTAGAALRTNQSRFDEQRAVAQKQNQTPFQAYADSLPRTADEIKNSFEQAAVDGVGRLNDGLADSVTHMLKLHGIAGEILKDFIDIAIKAGEAQLFGGGKTGGGGIGGLFGSLTKVAGSIFGGGGFGDFGNAAGFTSAINSGASSSLSAILSGARASGGPVSPGNLYRVGERGEEIFAPSMAGTIIPNHAIGTVDPNTRVSSPAVSGPVVHQTIQYSGAVDVADKAFVVRVAQAQYAATTSALRQGNEQTLRQAPGAVRQTQVLKG